MKALLHFQCGNAFRAALEAARPPWVDLVAVAEDDDTRLVRELADTEVLLHVLKPITGSLIDAAPRLRLIQKIGVGVNTIDLDAAASRGIAVCNMPGTNTRAVAEHTLLLMLAALRRLVPLDGATRAGHWSRDTTLVDNLGELGGRTVGLVGFGAVPRQLAPVLVALGAKVIACARREIDTPGVTRVALDALFRSADIVSLHLPLGADTEGLVDAGRIASMKPGAVLVNTARGGLVDEPALIAALRTGHLAAAALDVFGVEPVEASSALLRLPGVVVSPHVAWLTQETLERSIRVAFDNCRRLRDGDPLRHQVAAASRG